MRAALDNPPLVFGDRAERTATEAATHDVDREANHLVGRDLGLAIGRVRHAHIGHAEHVVHFLGAHRNGRWVEPDIHLTVLLHQRPRVAGIGFQVQHAVGVGVQHRIVAHLLGRGQANHGALAGQPGVRQQLHHLGPLAIVASLSGGLVLLDGTGLGVLGIHIGVDDLVDLARPVDTCGVNLEPVRRRVAADKRGAAHIGDFFDLLPVGQALRHLDDGPLSVAVKQNVGAGIDQDRVAHLVLPIVVVGNPAQRSLDAAEHDRHVLVGLLAALAVHQAGPIRALAGQAARGVGIVGADFFIGGVTVDHRVHVAGRDPEEQVRLTKLHKVVFGLPVRLGDDADAKALGLQQPADDRHAERGMVDVGIAGNDDDVAGIPAKLIHFFPAHRQERRRAKALGPVFWIIE